MDIYLTAYIALVLIYRGAETYVMTKTGTLTRRPRRDWTALLIAVPYWITLAGAALEYLTLQPARPTIIALVLGALLFVGATAVRVKAHLDLGAQFSMFLEEGRAGGLVTTGIYRTIRHPLYLANVLLFLACPTFLALTWSWIPAALGIAGVLTRIELEERFLMASFEGYATYADGTWKLVPRIY
jgi:protein-S-isoprenylcysteine O-methyltransferase Ste14